MAAATASRLPILQGSENTCVVCLENLSTRQYSCGHVIICEVCDEQEESFRLERGLPNRTCPKCRAIVTESTSALATQPAPVTLQNDVDFLSEELSYGVSLAGGETEIGERSAILKVRHWVEEVQAGRMTDKQLRARMRCELTRAEEELVRAELVNDQDLLQVIRRVDAKLADKFTLKRVQRQMVRAMVNHGEDAIKWRAGLSAVGTLGVTAVASAINGSAKFASSRLAQSLPAQSTLQYASEGVVGCLVCAVFTGVELYRWSKGEVTGQNCIRNIGEHTIGASGGIALGMAGAKTGAVIGTAALGPGAGTVLGVIFGCCFGFMGDMGARKAYRKLVPEIPETYETTEQVRQKLTPKEIAQRSADKFKVNLDCHSFAEARARYHKALLESHPDKFRGQSEDIIAAKNQEMIDIIACWNIVRTYYQDNHKEEVKDETVDEVVVHFYVMKVFDAASKSWKAVRAWLGEKGNQPGNTAEQRVKRLTYYM